MANNIHVRESQSGLHPVEFREQALACEVIQWCGKSGHCEVRVHMPVRALTRVMKSLEKLGYLSSTLHDDSMTTIRGVKSVILVARNW